MIGATWNKWDLHIHSPLTHQNNQFNGATIDQFVDQLITNEIALVGLTNYFYFDENELESIRNSIHLKGKSITVLGNLEFRITQPNQHGEWINVHCIFAEHLSTQEINKKISRLECNNTTPSGHKLYCCPASISQSQTRLDTITVDYRKLVEHLHSNFIFGVDFLIAVCPNGYGGFRPDRNEGRSIATAIEIEKDGQLVLGRAEDQDFFLNFLQRYEGAIPKPVFECSDAHSLFGFGEGVNRSYGVGEKYSWVKAKTTFEGLRQSLIEPESRVQLSDSFAERTFIKPRFKKLHIGGNIFPGQQIQFEDKEILLNPNMVAIIGGRGTGKSLLVDALKSRLLENNSYKNDRNISVTKLDITVDQGDGAEILFNNAEKNYPYLHVSQGDVKKFSEQPDELSLEIKKMLGIPLILFDQVLTDEIVDNIGKYRSFIEYWELADGNGNRINTPEYQQNIIYQQSQIIQTLTSPHNRQLIEQYQNNVRLMNVKQSAANELLKVQGLMSRYLNEINHSVGVLNQNENITATVPLINSQDTSGIIKSNLEVLATEVEQLKNSNLSIVASFQQQGINQDVSSLLSKVNESQSAIDNSQSKLIEIENRTNDYRTYVQRRYQVIENYKAYLFEQKQSIDNAFNALKQTQTQWNEEQNILVTEILKDIVIQGTVYFDVDKFYEGLQQCVNLGRFRSTQTTTTHQRLISTFNVRNIEQFFNLVSGNQIITCENDTQATSLEEFFWKSEYFNKGGRFELLNYLYSPESLKKFLHVNAVFEYKGKTVEKLSVGQRGTFYVCLKLATDPFGSPFVFDQPEDDLDNDFIMNQLVPLFSKIKKYRQVIIVTHNANLVVNTDAEQIIVAKNENEIISYESGAIEEGSVTNNCGIRHDICNILEGGSYAFEKRERKYGIQMF